MREPKKVREIIPTTVKLVRVFWPQIAEQGRVLWLPLITLVISIFLHVLEPWPLKFIYNIIFRAGAHRRLHHLPFLHTRDMHTQLIIMAAALIVIPGLASADDYFSTVFMALAASEILARVRSRVFLHLENLSMGFHFRKRTGDLITRVTTDLDRVRDVLVTAALPLLTNVLTVLAMLGVMFWMNWRLTLLALAAFPVFIILISRVTRSVKIAAKTQRQREAAVASTTMETLGSIAVVQALSLQDFFYQAFTAHNQQSFQEAARVQRLSAGLSRATEILGTIVTAVVLWIGAQWVIAGQISPGELIVFVSYLRKAFRPMRQLARNSGQIAKALASGERVLDLLETKPDITDSPNAVEASGIQGNVRFEKVSFGYQPDSPVLHDISFDFKPGQHIGLVGPSGSGKSTLASLLMRFYDPTAGRILLDGRDLRDYTANSLRSNFAIVFQESVLYSASVQENIGYGSLGASVEEIKEAAKVANADGFINELPQGYDTILGERGATLSGGERQRVAVARAALRKSPILILDEPTSSLDNRGDQAVSQALERLSKSRTTLWITHELAIMREMDFILYLEDGRIVERGTHDDLMAQGGRYTAMYEAKTTNSDSLYALET